MTPDSLAEFERRLEIYQSSVLPMCHAEGERMNPQPHRPELGRSSVERTWFELLISFLAGLFAVAGLAMVLWILTWAIWR